MHKYTHSAKYGNKKNEKKEKIRDTHTQRTDIHTRTHIIHTNIDTKTYTYRNTHKHAQN